MNVHLMYQCFLKEMERADKGSCAFPIRSSLFYLFPRPILSEAKNLPYKI